MIITTRFHGVLSDFVTTDTISFDMGPHATYGDLLKEIGQHFGPTLPSHLWDGSQNRFQSSILAAGEERNLKSMDTPLKADEEITFYLMLSGG